MSSKPLRRSIKFGIGIGILCLLTAIWNYVSPTNVGAQIFGYYNNLYSDVFTGNNTDHDKSTNTNQSLIIVKQDNKLIDVQSSSEINYISIPNGKLRDFIENIGIDNGIKWSTKHFSESKYISNICPNSNIFDIPIRYMDEIPKYYKKPLFCIIQNPYQRMINEYTYLNENKCDATYLNYGINKWIHGNYIFNDSKIIYNDKCNLLPQYYYIYNDNNQKICDTIIHIDTLKDSLNLLFKGNISLDKYNFKDINVNKCNFSAKKLSQEVVYKINRLYMNDFKYFNFTMIPANLNDIDWIKHAGNMYRQMKAKEKIEYKVNETSKCDILPLKQNNSVFHQKTPITLPAYPRRLNSYNITTALCVRLKNELSYIFEWIEYHYYIQKFDYIFIYNHKSTDNIEYLTKIYNNSWLKMYTATDAVWSELRGCMAEARKYKIDWLGHWDIDEFVYPSNYDTIKEYLVNEVIPKGITEVQVPIKAYGTYVTNEDVFKYDIIYDESNDKYKVINYNNGIQTVVGRYLYRANKDNLNGTDCAKYFGEHHSCYIMWKSIIKVSECASLDVHNCGRYRHKSIYKKDIYCNHYLLRNWKAPFEPWNWKKYKKWIELLTNINKNFYNRIFDNEFAIRYHDRISKRLHGLLGC